jgi:hypothetical protein
MAWSNGRVHYHRTGKGVVSEGYSCLPDGTDERLETGALSYPAGTHQSVEDVSPDGLYGLVTVERSNHPPNPDGWSGALPGVGTYNDLWLLDLASGQTWKLVDLLVNRTHSLIWPRFSTDGTKVVWTELWDYHWWDLGGWLVRVATLTWRDGVPSLTGVLTRKTSGFVEAYGTVDNGAAVLACATIPGISGLNAQIVKYPVTASGIGAPIRLSPKTPDEVWAPYQNYCEFAYPMPAFPDRIMFGRMFQGSGGSLEFWTMRRDGTDVQRLTYFSKPGHPQFVAATVILGGIAWDPDDPFRFVAGYATEPGNLNNNFRSLMVELAA